MTLLNSQQSLTQLAQTTPSPVTVSAVKAPPPRPLATPVPAVRPTVAQDQAALLVKPLNITYTDTTDVSKQCNTITTLTFLSPEGCEEDGSTDRPSPHARGDHPVSPAPRCVTFTVMLSEHVQEVDH